MVSDYRFDKPDPVVPMLSTREHVQHRSFTSNRSIPPQLTIAGNLKCLKCCFDPPRFGAPVIRSVQQSRRCSSWLDSNRRCVNLACTAVQGGRAETVSVVEYLLFLQAKPDVEQEEVEVLLDSLWSLQYMIPSIMYASAGNITNCTICNKHHQPHLTSQQYATGSEPLRSSNDGSETCELQQLSPGVFTHAIHYRLSSRNALEMLLLHPLMAAMQDKISAQCSSSAQLVFEGTVAKRLEALFRRGDEFACGVEHVMLLQPGNNGGDGADMFMERLAALAESSVAGGIQASYGAVISCCHTAATHVLMTRFAAQQQVEQLLATPACAAVMQRDPRVPVVAACSLCFSIQPAEESTQVNGADGTMKLN